jgi:bacteriocin biosynthesis cyclodehydratase domain-containing protein
MNDSVFSGVGYLDVIIPNKPQLVTWVTLVDIGDNKLQFRGPDFLFTLRNELFVEIFYEIKSVLDGGHTVEEISSTVDPSILPTTVIFLLKILRSHGLLQEGDLPLPEDIDPSEIPKYQTQLQFLSHLTQNPSGALELLRQSKLALIGEGEIKGHILSSLRKTGFASISALDYPQENNDKFIDSMAKELEGIEFLVACHQSTGYSFFEAVNSACLKSGTRWLRVAIEGTTAILGPTVVPNFTACYICLCKRLESNMTDIEDFRAYKQTIAENNIVNDEGFFSPLWEVISAQASLEVSRILLGFIPPKTISSFYEFNINSPVTVNHDVFRLPRCPSCNVRGANREAWNKAISLG